MPSKILQSGPMTLKMAASQHATYCALQTCMTCEAIMGVVTLSMNAAHSGVVAVIAVFNPWVVSQSMSTSISIFSLSSPFLLLCFL